MRLIFFWVHLPRMWILLLFAFWLAFFKNLLFDYVSSREQKLFV